jgi:hypothetical protein
MRSAVLTVLLLLFFQSRGIVYAIRYVAGIDSRDMNYASKSGHDVAIWLNSHMQLGQRVAFAGWNGYPYFVSPVHLLNSESVKDFQSLWQFCHCIAPETWTADFWNFYAVRDFTYTVIAKELVPNAVAVLPHNMKVEVAFMGRNDAVLRIERH